MATSSGYSSAGEQAFLAVGGDVDGEAGLDQPRLQRLAQCRFVLDHQYAHVGCLLLH